MNVKYTPEMDAWLRERYLDPSPKSNAELAFEFEQTFGLPMSRSRLSDWASSRGLKKTSKCIDYTPEMEDYLREIIPGHSYHEIADAFEKRFGIRLDKGRIGNAKTRLGVRSGTVGGRFERGHVPSTKGRSWKEQGRSAESNARSLTTCFRKGEVPPNGTRIPLGTERVTEDGYIQVKVSSLRRRRANDCWRFKHHLVWEEANGQAVPPSTMIVFADHDNRNFDPENLVAVPRSAWVVISRMHLPYSDRASLEAAVALAKLKSGIVQAKKRSKA